MNDHFIELARKTLKSALLAMLCGGFAACTDSYDLDDSGNSPSWLGGSIYEALKNPQMLENSGQSVLTGSFNNYVRLIDDLGYAETLNKTGSMTLFVANDSAFDRFFANNTWHVSKYEDLTMAQKMQLLRSSMLKNAILIEMLSNVTNDATSVTSGLALRHETVADVTDNIRMWGRDDMPANNAYWENMPMTASMS